MVDATTLLEPRNPAAWVRQPMEDLLRLSRAEILDLQIEAMAHRFETLRPGLAALDALADRQGVERIGSIDDALPAFFDHRVYKSYPLTLIEKRRFAELTTWFQRLTTTDLSAVPLDDVTSVDTWCDRLDDHGMIMGHSTGTTGKLSFIPRARADWPSWQEAYFSAFHLVSGVDLRTESLPFFNATYRTGHQMMVKMQWIFTEASAGGQASRHVLYDYPMSSDLLSLAGRLQAAEEKGTLDSIEIDPALIAAHRELIERGRHRDDDLQRWFATLADEFRGQKVRIAGTSADLTRIALAGREQGISCSFAPGSPLFAGGGMKGYTDAPDDWEHLVCEFFGADRICSYYGMSETMGLAPVCSEGYFHFLPHTIPVVLDEEARPLPTDGVQTGRFAVFDLLAEASWGGFITGDQVVMHWDPDCACGWRSPRIERRIARFAQMEGGDDKITCAGTAKAYNAFMDYVSNV